MFIAEYLSVQNKSKRKRVPPIVLPLRYILNIKKAFHIYFYI